MVNAVQDMPNCPPLVKGAAFLVMEAIVPATTLTLMSPVCRLMELPAGNNVLSMLTILVVD